MSKFRVKIIDAQEYRLRQQTGRLPNDLSYEEYVEIRLEQHRKIEERRAAMNPLDREILEFHEARHRREAEAQQQETERRAA